jgi:protein TonB
VFETSVVLTREAPRRKLGLFTVSIAGHTVIVAAMIAVSLARIGFPERSPRQMVDFILAPVVKMPPPIGVPRPAAAAPRPAAQKPAAVTAPQVVPPDIPVVPRSTAADMVPIATSSDAISGQGSSDTTGVGSGPAGSRDGVPGGVGDTPSVPEPATQIYRIGSGVSQPIVIHRVQPVYPPLALRAHIEGSVTVQCIVNRSGEIRDVVVIRSSFGAFEQSAVDAVRRWRFTPGMLAGKPVDTIFELTVNFSTH